MNASEYFASVPDPDDPNQLKKVIELPSGFKWPLLSHSTLFVRDFYQDCFEGVLQSLTDDRAVKLRKVVIYGNAGIGKSSFSMYVLYRALTMGRTVVLQSEEGVIVFSKGKAHDFVALTTSVLRLLQEYDTVYICDSMKPMHVNAFTIVPTSPTEEVYKTILKKPDCKRLCFPVWSWQEITQMHQLCFSDLPLSVVEHNYHLVGGIPRRVFTSNVEENISDMAVASSKFTSVKNVLRFIELRDVVDDNVAVHRYLHFIIRGQREESQIKPTDPAYYFPVGMRFASRFAADQVYRMLYEEDSAELIHFLLQSAGNPDVAATRSWLQTSHADRFGPSA